MHACVSGLRIRFPDTKSVLLKLPMMGKCMVTILALDSSERIREKLYCNLWLIQKKGRGRREKRKRDNAKKLNSF